MNQAIRKKLIDNAADNLDRHSMRMGMIGVRNREKFAAAFVDTMSQPGWSRDLFRIRCKGYGVNIMLIMLLAGIVWDILFYWWQNREEP